MSRPGLQLKFQSIPEIGWGQSFVLAIHVLSFTSANQICAGPGAVLHLAPGLYGVLSKVR